MTILRDISFLWSMFHVIALFLLLFEPRYSWKTTWIAGFAGSGILLSANVLLMFRMGHGIIMSAAFFTCTIPSMLLFFVLSKYRDGRFFFLFCLTDTTCFWLLQITNFLDRITGDTYVTLLLSRLLIFPVAELLFFRYLRRPYLELQRKLNEGWWLFAAVGATYYLLIMFTSVPVGTPMPGTVGMARILLVLILMPLTYLTIFHSLWRQMCLYETNRFIELQHREYGAICQKVELGRMFRHDMRHHLIVLEGMLRKDEISDARQYIRELSGRLVSFTETVWCANAAINMVLAAYMTQAEEAGCRVETEVQIAGELPYSEIDLCIILANTLENAIHACRGLPEEERQIYLKVDMSDNQRFTLLMDNVCPEPVAFDADGIPVASENEGHGLGLLSVRSVVKKYKGIFQNRWEEGRFSLKIVLFPPVVNKKMLAKQKNCDIIEKH